MKKAIIAFQIFVFVLTLGLGATIIWVIAHFIGKIW